jgi:hypothetical protein
MLDGLTGGTAMTLLIRVYDDAGNVIQTQEQAGDFREW